MTIQACETRVRGNRTWVAEFAQQSRFEPISSVLAVNASHESRAASPAPPIARASMHGAMQGFNGVAAGLPAPNAARKMVAACLLGALVAGTAHAQMKVGNNPTTLNANAVLEVESTNKGVLLPRVALSSTGSASPLSAHVAGMVVYNTATAGNVTPGLYENNGSAWVRLGNATTSSSCICGEVKQAIVASLGGDWKLADGSSAGTNSCGLTTLPNTTGSLTYLAGGAHHHHQWCQRWDAQWQRDGEQHHIDDAKRRRPQSLEC